MNEVYSFSKPSRINLPLTQTLVLPALSSKSKLNLASKENSSFPNLQERYSEIANEIATKVPAACLMESMENVKMVVDFTFWHLVTKCSILEILDLIKTYLTYRYRSEDAFDLGHALRTYPVRYDECLNTVLHMELGKFNRTIA